MARGPGDTIRALPRYRGTKTKPVFGTTSNRIGVVGMLPMAASAGDLKQAWALFFVGETNGKR
jgi:hypothetical protein